MVVVHRTRTYSGRRASERGTRSLVGGRAAVASSVLPSVRTAGAAGGSSANAGHRGWNAAAVVVATAILLDRCGRIAAPASVRRHATAQARMPATDVPMGKPPGRSYRTHV